MVTKKGESNGSEWVVVSEGAESKINVRVVLFYKVYSQHWYYLVTVKEI